MLAGTEEGKKPPEDWVEEEDIEESELLDQKVGGGHLPGQIICDEPPLRAALGGGSAPPRARHAQQTSPPPGPSNGASRSGAFLSLLKELEAEHSREVATLHQQIEKLRASPVEVQNLDDLPELLPDATWNSSEDISMSKSIEAFGPPSPTTTSPKLCRRSLTTRLMMSSSCDLGQPWATGTQATLLVSILRASNLRRADWGPGRSSDPFCVCGVSSLPDFQISTDVVQNNRNPVWNYKAAIVEYAVGDSLDFCVKDHDWGTQGDSLGKVKLSASALVDGKFSGALQLEETGQDAPSYLHILVEPLAVPDVRKPSKGGRLNFRGVWESPPEEVLATTDSMADFGSEAWGDMGEKGNGGHHRKKSCLEKVIFRPGSSGRVSWELFGLVLLVLDLLWMPMSTFEFPESTASLTLQWTTLLYWTLDICGTLNTAFFDEKGTMVAERKAIVLHYVRTWMVFDIMLVGLDWYMVLDELASDKNASAGAEIDPSMARSARLARISRVVRMLRMMRLAKLKSMTGVIDGLVNSEYTTVLIAVGKNIGVIFVTTHFLACLFFAVGRSNGDDPDESWVARAGLLDKDSVYKYLVALQWSLAQFTPGATPVQPLSVNEKLMSVTVLAVGLVMATCFVSSITSTMASLWQMQRYNSVQGLLLTKFLRQHKVKGTLIARIQRHVEFSMESRRKRVHMNKVEFLKLLSEPLHRNLQIEMFSQPLTLFPCFEQCQKASEPAMEQLCAQALTSKNYARGEQVFGRDQKATEMYVSIHGTLLYCFHFDGESVDRIEPVPIEKWFVEGALWTDWRHRGDMKSTTEVDTVNLDVFQFCSITVAHPKAYLIARIYALHFFRELADRGQLPITDMPLELQGAPANDKGKKISRSSSQQRVALGRVVWAVDSKDDGVGAAP